MITTKFNMILYSHTDYMDVCEVFFNQMEKFVPDYEKTIFINQDNNLIPKNYTKIYYDNNLPYRERLLSCLNKIDSEIILFIHEDMFLYDHIDKKIILEFVNLILEDKVDFIKLIKTDGHLGGCDIHPNLVASPKYNLFSIQPTLCSRNKLIKILEIVNANSIYDIEYNISKTCIDLGLTKSFMSSCDGEIKRGSAHYDSNIFPYVATAINKGRWNFMEYSTELSNILNEYGIDKNKRGVI